MSGGTQLVQVEIFGQTYKLKAEDDPAYVESLASYVDARMQDVARQTRAVDSMRVAVLAALNIADEHHRSLKRAGAREPAAPSSARARRAAEADAALDQRAADLVRILEEAMEG